MIDANATSWLAVGLMMLLGVSLPAAPIIIQRILAPYKPNPIKNDVYECGVETVGETWIQFKAQYYIFALAFVIFDVEVVFLFPWAVAFNQLGFFSVLAGIVFISILLIELLIAWRQGSLEWV